MDYDQDRDWSAVGPGWHSILDQLANDLAELDPPSLIDWYKQKFAGLRVGIDPSSEIGLHLKREAGDISRRTCELCGKPGRVMARDGYYQTFAWMMPKRAASNSRRRAPSDL